jgi:hypothetical protein
MSIKDLPQSLIQATEEVMSSSSEHTKNLSKKIFSEGLKKFNVSDVNQLSDSDQKAFFSWAQNEFNKRHSKIKVINEQMTDDQKFSALSIIPHVSTRRMDGGKSVDLELMGKTLASKVNAKNTSNAITITPEGERLLKSKGITNLDKTMRMRIFSESENKCGCEKVQEDDMPGDEILHKDGDQDGEKKKDLGEMEDNTHKLTENISIAPDQLAVNGAVGCLDADSQMPIHADVLRDTSPVDGKTELRLFVQFNTNSLPVIVPPVVLPGAPDINSLREIVEDLPIFCDVVERALVSFVDVKIDQK